MTDPDSAARTRAWIDADRAHQWHPFTQMRDWCAPGHEPHRHRLRPERELARQPRARVHRRQQFHLDQPPRPQPSEDQRRHLPAARSVRALFVPRVHASGGHRTGRGTGGRLFPPGTLTRVFFSDDGATAIEAALRMARQYWQLVGQPERRKFLAFDRAYHGDTVGAASLGGIPMIHGRLAPADDVLRVGGVDALDALPASEVARVGRGGDRTADPGRGGDASVAAGDVEKTARVVRPARGSAHRRRGDDRLRPHGHDVRLRTGGRVAGFPVSWRRG